MSTSTIISIYNSRKNLLEILEERGFAVANYSNFSITDVGILTENNQLDMLLGNATTNKKIYVDKKRIMTLDGVHRELQLEFNLINNITKLATLWICFT